MKEENKNEIEKNINRTRAKEMGRKERRNQKSSNRNTKGHMMGWMGISLKNE